jgi:SAM-dependent methyltransferase
MALAGDLQPGRLIEPGPGAGALLIEFAGKGFSCEGLEVSDEARALAERTIASSGLSIPLHSAPDSGWKGRFDVLFSFDVLEHVEDDRAALAQWASWLRPGGILMLSVPARMSLWSPGDEWAGHYRRYERNQLRDLLTAAGFELEVFECYGFPAANLAEWASAGSYRRRIRRGSGSEEEDRRANNDRSGIDRGPHMRLFPLLKSVPGRLALRCALAAQNAFLKRDLGNGYVVRARRL